jgi:hypothetical protein
MPIDAYAVRPARAAIDFRRGLRDALDPRDDWMHSSPRMHRQANDAISRR